MKDSPFNSDQVDWPPTEEIRDALRCGDLNCRCHRESGNVHCPAHEDNNPTLSLNDAPDAQSGTKPLWHCHAGCPQERVTKALYERLFGSSDATDGVTTSGAKATKPETPKAFKSLRERGISLETRNYFELQEYASLGVIIPTFYLDGVRGPVRIKAAYPNGPKYRWRDQTPSGENEGDRAEIELPSIYNADVIHAAARMEAGLFITKSEAETWTMHQAGLAAVCLLGDKPDFEPLVAMLRAKGVKRVVAIFGNDLSGRRSAIRLREVCEVTNTADFKVAAVIRLIEGPLGSDLGDLFASVKFNTRRFRDEIEQLPFVPGSLLDAWRQNPEAGLPTPISDDATEGATANASNIGADGLFECLDEADLQALPLPECLVEGVVLEGRPTIFYGLFGTGKSLIALDMALSVSQNMPWCGRETKPGMAFFVAGEGANGLKKRVAAWKQHHGVKSTPLFRVIPHPIILSDPAQCRSLIATIKDQTQATGTPAALILVDTLALSLRETGDENSAGEMTLFLKAAESICLATGAAVLILHHPNRQGDARGSTALPSNSDGFLALEGKTSSEVVKLNPSKVRDMGENGGIKLRRVVITLEDMLDSKGKPVTSAVFFRCPKGKKATTICPMAHPGRGPNRARNPISAARRRSLRASYRKKRPRRGSRW